MLKSILKKIWKRMIIIAIVVVVLCMGAFLVKQRQTRTEEKVKLTEGSVMNFDIASYNHLGEDFADIYDYTSVWYDDVLLNDYVEKLDESKDVLTLNKNWKNMSNDDKKNWIKENITIQRLSSSTMYRVVYTTSVPTKEKKKTIKATKEIINEFWDYATNLSVMSDGNLKYEIVKNINIQEDVVEVEGKGNKVMYMLLSVVLAGMICVTYFGIEVIKYKKKED